MPVTSLRFLFDGRRINDDETPKALEMEQVEKDPSSSVTLFSGIDEILDLEKISRGNGSFFSISSWRIEFSFLEMFSNVKILKKKFSFSSRNSRF